MQFAQCYCFFSCTFFLTLKVKARSDPSFRHGLAAPRHWQVLVHVSGRRTKAVSKTSVQQWCAYKTPSFSGG